MMGQWFSGKILLGALETCLARNSLITEGDYTVKFDGNGREVPGQWGRMGWELGN